MRFFALRRALLLRVRLPFVLAWVAAAAGALVPARVGAQARPAADTTAPPPARRVHELPRAEVTGRPVDPGLSIGARVTHLHPAADLPGATLATLLASRAGLTVRQYGPGQLASLSVRGTSARHVAVLWYGFNLNFPTLGEGDLSLTATDVLSGASVQHGPASTRYGNGALGAALTLQTAPDYANRTSGERLSVGVGAWGQRQGTLEVARADADSSGRQTGFRTVVQGSLATNDFPYRVRTFQGSQTEHLVNAATRQYTVVHDHQLSLGPRLGLSAAAWLTGTDREVAPAIGTPNRHAREQDYSQRLVLALHHGAFNEPSTQPAGTTDLRVAFFRDQLTYRDDQTTRSVSHSWSSQALLAHARLLTPAAGRWAVVGRGGLEAQLLNARATNYAAGWQRQPRVAGWAGVDVHHSNRFSAQLHVRQAVVAGQWVPLTPSLGFDWRVGSLGFGRPVHDKVFGRAERPHQLAVHLKGAAARAYRAPTLNERYWQPGGNPDLQAETSVGTEAGVLGHYWTETAAGQVQADVEVTAYRQHVRDWVQWLPTDNAFIWSPRNLRQVGTRGLESAFSLRLPVRSHGSQAPDLVTLTATAQLTEARKRSGYAEDFDPVGVQLAYVPRRVGSLLARYAWQARKARAMWFAEAAGTATDRRNTTASGTESLPAYALLDAAVGWRQPGQRFTPGVRLDVRNLTNTRYQSVANRAQPGTSWLVTLSVEWLHARASSQ